jgi:AraC family transcriptional regulator of adaptative response / DNA-3-methyladenine glycosylase II
MDPDVCYRAVQARDARFDGLFFIAVRTTRIFCRPVCPARTPLRRNVEFFANAAAAQAAGYRPCLRCRPEVSPDLPVWAGTSATVNRALRLIDEGALDRGSTGELAGRLGLTDRHLRRLFLEHVGAAPVVVAQTRRTLFAKKLITETSLPFSEIAFQAGFTSLRRFNEAMRAV